MKLDYERMKVYAKLPDTILWAQVVSLAAKHGITLPKKTPPKEDMARLRRIMTGEEQMNLTQAIALFKEYKGKTGGATHE